jgi:hypothetical protein
MDAKVAGVVAIVSAVLGCSADAPPAPPPRDAPASSTPPPPPPPPPFHADFGDAGADDAAPAASPATPADPAFDARLKSELRGVVRGAYADHDWETLLRARVPWSGVVIWVPGTGERTADDASGRAMGSVPSGLTAYDPWLGVPCAQSIGGGEFAKLDRLSALEVFTTAWPDAVTLASTLGSKLAGAWIVGHSAGALPAILAGLLGGAHRVDAYGVPSAVGALDGDDGLVHLHTDPLDPAGAMGSLDASGDAQIDLLSAFVVTIKAGGSLAHHDYASWPAPAP